MLKKKAYNTDCVNHQKVPPVNVINLNRTHTLMNIDVNQSAVSVSDLSKPRDRNKIKLKYLGAQEKDGFC